MAYIVNTLPDYVEERKGELLKSAVQGFDTYKYVNHMAGVKYKQALNVLDVNPVLQDGESCGWDASGNVSYTQRVMEVKPVKVNMELCDRDLRKKWQNYEFETNVEQDNLIFAEKVMDRTIERIHEQIENLVWNGSTGAGDRFNGFLTILDAEADVIDASAGATDYETAKNVWKKIPGALRRKAEGFCGQDMLDSIIEEITAKNLFHYVAEENDANTITLPGTKFKIHGVPGLDETGRIVAADPENLFYGFNASEDESRLGDEYKKSEGQHRIFAYWLAGTQVAFPNEVVVSEAPEA